LAEWEASATALASSGTPDSIASQLNVDARNLLVAAKAGGGHIMYIRSLGGASIQAANKNFIDPFSDREEARWKSAIDELRGYRLIESAGSKGETFRMTKLGYEVADSIEGEK
jgi:hypothetical protein